MIADNYDYKPNAGFTLVELLVVVSITGLLALIAIPTFLNQRKKAQDAHAKSSIRTSLSEVKTMTDKKNDWADFDSNTLRLELSESEPDLTYVSDFSPESSAPNVVNVSLNSADSVSLLARSDSGTFFCAIARSNDTTQYGRASTVSDCLTAAASDNTSDGWSNNPASDADTCPTTSADIQSLLSTYDHAITDSITSNPFSYWAESMSSSPYSSVAPGIQATMEGVSTPCSFSWSPSDNPYQTGTSASFPTEPGSAIGTYNGPIAAIYVRANDNNVWGIQYQFSNGVNSLKRYYCAPLTNSGNTISYNFAYSSTFPKTAYIDIMPSEPSGSEHYNFFTNYENSNCYFTEGR